MDQELSFLQELSVRFRKNSSWEFHLWRLSVLILAIMTMGFWLMTLPPVLWRSGIGQPKLDIVSKLSLGFLLVMIAFNIYMVLKRRQLNRGQQALLLKLMERISLMTEVCDPATEVLSRSFIDVMLPKELARAERDHSPLTFATFGVEKRTTMGVVDSTFERRMLILSQLLTESFRNSDVISRYSENEFLVVMPKTSEVQAQGAIARVHKGIEWWNSSSVFQDQLEVGIGSSEYISGNSHLDAIGSARRGAVRSSTIVSGPG